MKVNNNWCKKHYYFKILKMRLTYRERGKHKRRFTMTREKTRDELKTAINKHIWQTKTI